MDIDSNWHGAVERVRRVRSAKGRAAQGAYSIEGIRLVERALWAGMPLTQVLIDKSWKRRPSSRQRQLLNELEETGCPIVAVPHGVMAELVNGRSLGHILGLVQLPQFPTLAQACEQAMAAPLLLVAVDVVDPGNLGAMVRTAHASGCTALVTIGVSDPFHPKAVRTSMGSLFKLPIVQVVTVDELLAELRAGGIVSVGTAVSGGVLLPMANFGKGGTAVFLGNEYFGLPDELANQMDSLVTIPMVPGVDSFSVNAAAAIILYDIQRRGLSGVN